MNPFMLPASERLDAWSEFRDSLSSHAEEMQLAKVAEYWAQCPYGNWSMDPEDSKTWVSAWEMLHEGEYCRNAIALGMEATLRYAGWNANRLKLVMVKNLEDGEEFFVVIIDNLVVLNYSYAEITKVDDLYGSIDTLYTYQFVGRTFKLSA